MNATPYKGLVPYTEADSKYFFGRESERETIGGNLKASPLTVLYGASGVGKSSVIRAGVVCEINQVARNQSRRGKRPSFIAICCQDWRDDPMGSAAEAVKRTLESLKIPVQKAVGTNGSEDLYSLLRANVDSAEARLLLVLDQFEEYLRYHGSNESSHRMDEALAEIVNDTSLRVNVMISLRDDSLSMLDHYKGLIHSVFNNYLRIDHISLESGRDAILKPIPLFCEQYGCPEILVEPELLQAVLEQVQIGQLSFSDEGGHLDAPGERRIQAPYLQLVMMRLWKEEQEANSGVLRRETLKRLGESTAIVRNHLNETMDKFSLRERELAERIFFHLVTPSGTKIAHNVADLAAFTGAPEREIGAVVSKLADPTRRILRAVSSLNPEGASRFEIYHDALAEGILAWQSQFRAQLARERIAKEVSEAEHKKREMEKHRFLRRLLVAATSAILVLAFMTWFGFRASREATVAEAEALRQKTQAEVATELANQRLDRIRKGLQLRQAALSGNQQQVAALVGSLGMNAISFKATARYLGYQNPSNQRVYEFKLFPDPATLPQGDESIAFITYLADHPTFRNTLMTAGANRNFTASYIGWGCLQRIVAVVEYSDPSRLPTVKEFNGCSEAGR
jgi:hypothetical protein